MKSKKDRLMRIMIAIAIFMGIPFMTGYANVYAQTSPEVVKEITIAEEATVEPTSTPVATATPGTTNTTIGTVDYTSNSAVPMSATGEKVDGSATAVDYTYQGEKEFYSFKTKDGNTYYLIVDNEKTVDNVYFLTEINDSQLSVGSSTNTTVNQQTSVATPAATADTQATAPAKSNNNTLLLVVLILVVGGGAGYYFKIVKPKKAKAAGADEVADEEDDDLIDDEYENEETEE